MISIVGEKICLRSFIREEYHQFKKSYISDPIMDPDIYVYDREKVDKAYGAIVEKEAFYAVVGIFLRNETPIGSISFKRIDQEESRCEIGIVISNDNYKGHGYGSEAIELAVKYATETLKLKNIYADTMGSNLKMQHILDKFGFRLVNIEKHRYDMHDRWEDKLNYVLNLEPSMITSHNYR